MKMPDSISKYFQIFKVLSFLFFFFFLKKTGLVLYNFTGKS